MNAFLSAWHWPLPQMVASAAALVFYFLKFRPREAGRIACFVSGLALFILTIASPLDLLGRQYLLSAEVIMHVIVALAVPLCLVGGLPRSPDALPGNRILPYVGWVAGSLTIAVWFLPSVFDATLKNSWLWDVMQITLVAGGVAFWWPLFSPARTSRIKPVPAGIWYLFGAMIWCSFAGMLLAFTNLDAFQPYVRVQDTLGILSFIREDLELTRAADQETGGMLLWLGTMAIFLTTVMVLFYQWYRSPEVRNEFEPQQAATVKKAREGQA